MKRRGLLNAPLAKLIAELGHTDMLVIADAGLPIPPGVPRIDLALRPGLPGFVEVFDVLVDELCVEGATLAQEIREANSGLHDKVERRLEALEQRDGRSLARDFVSHDAFKRLLPSARAVIRTGECSPYANIALHSGVAF